MTTGGEEIVHHITVKKREQLYRTDVEGGDEIGKFL